MALDTALTTTAAVKIYLNIDSTNTNRDTAIAALVTRYSSAVSVFCNRTFLQADLTQYHSGDGTPDIWVDNYPITSPVTGSYGLWLDSNRAFGSSTILDEDVAGTGGGDYILIRGGGEEGCGRIRRKYGTWPLGDENIKTTLQCGYASGSIPNPVVEAVHMWIGKAFQVSERRAWDTTTTSTVGGGGSVTFVEHKMPLDIESMLIPWRRPSRRG